MKKKTNRYETAGKRESGEAREGARKRYEPGSVKEGRYQDRYEVPRERISEEERMRRRRALRRKRERQRRRRLLIASAVAVLVLGGCAFEIVHLMLRDKTAVNTWLSANAGQALEDGARNGSLQENTAGADGGTLDTDGEETDSLSNEKTDESGMAAGTYPNGADHKEEGKSTENETENNGEGDADSTRDRLFSETAQLDSLNSPYAILMDASTGEVLAEHNADTQMYPASMTKILTAVTAMESVSSLDETVTMPYEIYEALYEEGASMAGFEAGEQASVRALLYGVILPSGAECCITLADLIDGSENVFVQRMNEKAQQLGMNSSHFVTSTGLHDAQHYSTVRDIAVLLQYALQNSDFREIFMAHSYSVAPSAQHPEGFTFYSTMFQSLGDATVTNGEILGGKTGYTEEAGLCLASFARVNEKEYILVTAGAPGSHDTEPLHTMDAKTVYNRIGTMQN